MSRFAYLRGSSVGFIGLLLAGIACAQTQPAPSSCDDQKFLSDRQAFEVGGDHTLDLPEHVCGTVTRVSRQRKTRSGLHGYFMVDIGQNQRVRIVSDLAEMDAPAWPWVHKGDKAEIVGRYYYDNRRSQGIDWTHHGTGREWSIPGYVIVNGTKYQ